MVQILKEESKKNIIEAAKEEFLDKGFKEASMRSIAKKSNMTVGNLYRYFKNKNDIIMYIVSNTLGELDNYIQFLTNNKISLQSDSFDLKLNFDDIKKLLINISDSLVDIYSRYTIEFKILMLHSDLNSSINDWLTNLISSLISQNLSLNEKKDYVNNLASVYADSIFEGVKKIFTSNNNIDELKATLKIYLLSIFNIFTNDIKEYVE